ncbi:hypothetical protein L3Y34_010643 [Caenorhabditis briggsae]|uniref:Receptor L-domain domain-containing protein n=1 Tax=Caenorhabditis briggsae TaxID=6238 RepID=A0AAE8ZQK0_CAEBR|nr:hypothetical protein L3Y34_010643 [Caenorhabditis briggsae]
MFLPDTDPDFEIGQVNSVEITNNRNLTSLGFDFKECTYCYSSVQITNNPKLDLKKDCDGIIAIYNSRRKISGNLADCGCEIIGDFNSFIATMPSNCWMLFGNVTIDENSDLGVLEKNFANVTRINGGLSVQKTLFSDLSFLRSIESIDSDPYHSTVFYSIVIKNNPNLISLGMNAKRDGLYLIIRDNPKLCVTPQELSNFYAGVVLDSNLDITVCFNNETSPKWCQLGNTTNLANLPEECEVLVGDLVFDEEFDFDNSYKLFYVEYIFGSFTITNSSLRTLNMLPNLIKVRSIRDNKIPIHIFNNSGLYEIFVMFNFQGVESGESCVIENNPSLAMDIYTCSILKGRKEAKTGNNFQNCGDDTTTLVRKYDSTPLNIDVYKGVPKFLEVSHAVDGPGTVTQNNPWDRNFTSIEDSDEDEYDEPEGSTSYPPNFIYLNIAVVLLIFLIFE